MKGFKKISTLFQISPLQENWSTRARCRFHMTKVVCSINSVKAPSAPCQSLLTVLGVVADAIIYLPASVSPLSSGKSQQHCPDEAILCLVCLPQFSLQCCTGEHQRNTGGSFSTWCIELWIIKVQIWIPLKCCRGIWDTQKNKNKHNSAVNLLSVTQTFCCRDRQHHAKMSATLCTCGCIWVFSF